jgi:hypothetical protein
MKYPVQANFRLFYSISLYFALVILSTFVLSGCEEAEEPGTGAGLNLTVDMDIPNSITGGNQGTTSGKTVLNAISAKSAISQITQAGNGEPCSFIGIQDDDPFRNGYQTTKFMTSIMATWTCIADLLIDITAFVPHNQMIETDNDTNAANYDDDEATHYSVTDDSETQVTVRLYYGYNRSSPPVMAEDPKFYVSFNDDGNDNIDGRLIIDGLSDNWENQDSDDPVMMRMDFNFTSTNQTADMFMQFDNGNQWAEGFRIKLSKDLTASPLGKVYVVKGLMNLKAQFLPVDSIDEIAQVQFFTVTDQLGNGAAIAEFQDLSFPLVLNKSTNNHLGNYLFTKKDIYFFESNQDWEYINKTVISSEYRDGRTTATTGGSWIPFDPSIDLLVAAFSLDSDYFTGSKCALENDDCNDFINAMFNDADGFAGHEHNQGSDPMDWRSAEIDNAVYLESVYPNGVNWTGAFEFDFTPGQ